MGSLVKDFEPVVADIQKGVDQKRDSDIFESTLSDELDPNASIDLMEQKEVIDKRRKALDALDGLSQGDKNTSAYRVGQSLKAKTGEMSSAELREYDASKQGSEKKDFMSRLSDQIEDNRTKADVSRIVERSYERGYEKE